MQYYFLATTVVAFSVLYTLYLVVYRLYLSPIAHIPGPRWAAVTFWYEFYFDVIKGGQYTNEIERMHEKYGPVVRINPFEVHINDVNVIDAVYPLGKRVDKWDWQTRLFPIGLSMFGTIGHDLHAARRASLAPFFSKRSIAQLEPVIEECIDKMVSRLKAMQGSGECVDLFQIYAALTGDVISAYCFGHAQGFLDSPDYATNFRKFIVDGLILTPIFKQFGNGEALFKKLPERLVGKISPQMLEFVKMKRHLRAQLEGVKEKMATGMELGERTIFSAMFASNLPQSEKSVERMIDEGQTLMNAGTLTTADTLSVITFHLLNNPTIRLRLQEELAFTVKKEKVSVADFEQLPYLAAVIKEGIRISYGVTQRLPRIFPVDSFRYNEWIIPPGTPISMSCQLVHDNPTLFPNPRSFNPDRWLIKDESTTRLDKYILSFSRGTRQCIGINLAYAELFLTIPALFSPGKGMELKLFETTTKDVEPIADFFTPGYSPDSKGIRVTVH